MPIEHADVGILTIEHADLDGNECLALVTGGELYQPLTIMSPVSLGIATLCRRL